MGLADDVAAALSPAIAAVQRTVDGISGTVGSIKTKLDTLATDVANQVQTQIVGAITGALDTMASTFFDNLKSFLTGIFSQPNLPQLKPVDPNVIVSQISAAIRDAESTLNQKGLLIAQGTVELDVYLSAGVGVADAGARAHIVLTINPRT